ncbi:(2Fe-2S)-binding protein [Pseudomonas sp. NPDC089734]|uniref:(2Fe-2S)-binding protein n=1 Tax=Pseudomonas sp. NPDC089734 TaxID=3364469 RepID=UPI0037FE6585
MLIDNPSTPLPRRFLPCLTFARRLFVQNLERLFNDNALWGDFLGDGMFVPVGVTQATLTVYFDGQPIAARQGETIASCLLRAGVEKFRTTPVSGSPRLPFCMIGHCFECVVEIEGIGGRQACLSLVEEGMHIRTQLGAAELQGIKL